MKFCTKCGKQLADDEVCTCQSENTAQAAPEAATADGTQAFTKPIITKEQATEISKSVLSYVSEFFKHPVAAAEAVVGEHSMITVCGLVAVNAAFELIVDIIRMILSTLRYEYISYSVGDYIRIVLMDIVWWIAIPAAFAGLILAAGKFIYQQDISIKKALSVFAIPAIPLLAFTALSLLGIILSHSFFAVIFAVVRTAISGIMLYLTVKGIFKVLPNTDKFMYTSALLCAGLYFANWLVVSVIF